MCLYKVMRMDGMDPFARQNSLHLPLWQPPEESKLNLPVSFSKGNVYNRIVNLNLCKVCERWESLYILLHRHLSESLFNVFTLMYVQCASECVCVLCNAAECKWRHWTVQTRNVKQACIHTQFTAGPTEHRVASKQSICYVNILKRNYSALLPCKCH